MQCIPKFGKIVGAYFSNGSILDFEIPSEQSTSESAN
jgi:hypothetical protein